MPPRSKGPRNLADLIRSRPLPTEVDDGQLRQLALQLILDNPDDSPDPRYARMKTKLECIKLLHEMNHTKDKEDRLSVVLAEALRDR